MQLIRGLHNLRQRHRGCVVTIGNFDGVHRGHYAVLAHLRERAKAMRLPSLVMVFEPTPDEHFAGRGAPARLMRLREKFEAISPLGIDRVLCLRFDETLANLEPDAFIRRILVDGLGVGYLVVGDDFRFGRDRLGDFSTLQGAGEQYGFQVAGTMSSVTSSGVRISSTAIRAALSAADFGSAASMLGRPFRLSGRVVPGERLGRTLGFPTANIRLGPRRRPLHGVYAVRVAGVGNVHIDGVASIGSRPTVRGRDILLEVFLFDFDRDIYRRYLHVDFYAKLRDEEGFASVEAMQEQMRVDAREARVVLAQGLIESGRSDSREQKSKARE